MATTNYPLLATSTSGQCEQQTQWRRASEAISRLLTHYWTAADEPAARQAQIEDWLELVGQTPISELRAACMRWLRTESRRPTPADIVALLAPPVAEPVYYRPFPRDPRTLDEIADHRRSIAHRWQDVLQALKTDPTEIWAEMQAKEKH